MKEACFLSASPVWQTGKELEMNHSLRLRAVCPGGTPATLRITSHARYQLFVNGSFRAAGPARAPHGFFRVREYDLTPWLTGEENLICLVACGGNVNSFYLTDQPSFICAEIVSNGETLFATGSDRPFTAEEYVHRQKKVQRFSFQRPFTESYICDALWDLFMTRPDYAVKGIPLVPTAPKAFIESDTPAPSHEERRASAVVSRGIMLPRPGGGEKYHDRSLDDVDGRFIKGFPEQELEYSAVDDVRGYQSQILETERFATEPVKLGANCFAVYDMGVDTTGYLRLNLTAEQDTVIVAVFTETIEEGGVPAPGFGGCANVLRWVLQGGRTYELVSFEPYTWRYIQVISFYAPALVTNVSQYAERFPDALLTRRLTDLPDADLQKIYDAAAETFCQNATDIFMDCPSRERAGWLCDSFFTARSEYTLTGASAVETAFIENFLMAESYGPLPDGMLPMCWPADHPDGAFIPNWAMWFVLQLREYRERTGRQDTVEWAKPKLLALAEYFTRFENEFGLLEKLESWVFVEWSRANDFTQDVSFPTNMLYALYLDATAALTGETAFSEKARRVREAVRARSFDGTWFTDNEVRGGDGLTNPGNHTETCQYYAFFTGTATPESHPELYRAMLTEFGPGRDDAAVHPDVPVSNAFIGNYLRLEILFKNGETRQLTDEIRSFFLPMAERTGTLWENMTPFASCCHGFASSVVYWLQHIFG